MLRERLDLLANRILNDDAFGDAVAYLCTHLSNAFKQEQRLVRALGDFGAFATVMCAVGIASVHGGQFTLAAVQAVVVPPGWASSRRTRALIDWLELENTAQRHPPGGDNRERPWSLNGWIISAIERLASTIASRPRHGKPSGNGDACGGSHRNGRADRRVSWFLRHAQDLPFLSEGMRMFLGHAPGFLILLDLLSAAKTDACDATGCVFSQGDGARLWGQPRPCHGHTRQGRAVEHLAKKRTQNSSERAGIAERPARSGYQLAFVVLWAEAVRTSPPSADAPRAGPAGMAPAIRDRAWRAAWHKRRAWRWTPHGHQRFRLLDGRRDASTTGTPNSSRSSAARSAMPAQPSTIASALSSFRASEISSRSLSRAFEAESSSDRTGISARAHCSGRTCHNDGRDVPAVAASVPSS